MNSGQLERQPVSNCLELRPMAADRWIKSSLTLLRVRIALALWFFFAMAAGAHEIRPAVVTVTFAPPDYSIEISANVEAMLAGVSPKHADTSESPNAKRYDELRLLSPDALSERVHEFAPELIKGLAVEFDGERATP